MDPILPGLTLVMLVRNPPTQVAAIAGLFREVADEIIICVDSRVDQQLLQPLIEVSDVLTRVEIDTSYANSSWLIGLANREWVLIVDGDEVPSTALLERLRHLDELSTEVMFAYVGMKWLWPTTNEYLVDEPWRDDPQLRLIRRSARILNWPAGLHEAPRIDGKGVFLPEALFHLDLAMNKLNSRREKVSRYDAGESAPHPGFRESISSSYYLPEDRPTDLQKKVVSDEDGELISRVVTASVANPVRKNIDLPITPIASIRDANYGPAGSLDEYRSHMEVIDPPSTALAGKPIRVSIKLTNLGNWTWQPHRSDGGIGIGWSIQTDEGTVSTFDGRALLLTPLKSQQSILIPCYVEIPETHSDVIVRFRLVEEFSRWFDEEISILIKPRWTTYDELIN
jgi:hypothetical protein